MKNIPLILSLLINFCVIPNTVLAQQNDIEISKIENGLMPNIYVNGEKKERYNLLDRMKYHNVPGVSVAIVKNGKLHWSKAYGVTNKDLGSKTTTATMFQVASISKPITALGILKLVEENKIRLDEEANTYLKGWQIEENEFTETEKVTIRRLLNHTAGLNVQGFDGYAQNDEFPNTIEVLNGEGNSESVAVSTFPGTEWNYSGGGYVVLQKIIEDVTGLSFEDYMTKEVLDILKMNNSTFEQPLNKEVYKNVSSAHNNDGEVIVGNWHNYPEKGAGGLWSTPEDLAKYCIEIHQILKGKKDGLLKKETLDLMLTKGLHNWGLGPLVEGSGKDLRFRHDGKNEGYFSDFLAFAHKGDAVIVTTNGNSSDLTQELLKSISAYYNWNTHNQRTIAIQKISVEELKKFTGTYAWTDNPNWTPEIQLVDGKLHFIASGFPTYTLAPLGDNDFIDLEAEVKVRFKTSPEGQVNSLIFRGRFECNKIQ